MVVPVAWVVRLGKAVCSSRVVQIRYHTAETVRALSLLMVPCNSSTTSYQGTLPLARVAAAAYPSRLVRVVKLVEVVVAAF